MRMTVCMCMVVWVMVPALGSAQSPESKAAVANTGRPEADVKRDVQRKPAAVLDFFGIKPGMAVADLMAGGGYYTELLSHLVGPTGTVYAQNNKIALERFADAAMTKRLADNRLPRVVRLDKELEAPGLPDGKLDAVLLVLFYHDTYWQKVDRDAMNAAVLKALKPGGIFGVIDHAAAKGAGSSVNKSLHRIEESLLKQEILKAGFTLDASNDLLRNESDDHSINVFKSEIRGKTDRFVLRFRKGRTD